ncbi:MAG: hypothetical protein ACE5JG_10275 [Planctomycetota bacterium]
MRLLRKAGYTVEPRGATVWISPEPPLGDRLALQAARSELIRVVHGQDRTAAALLEGTEALGLILWVEAGDLHLAWRRVPKRGDLPPGQFHAMVALLEEYEQPLEDHLRRLGRTARPGDLPEREEGE